MQTHAPLELLYRTDLYLTKQKAAAFSAAAFLLIRKRMINMKTCCIFGAGEYYGGEKLPDGEYLSIAADGGYTAALNMGIKPNVFIGDFDSLNGKTVEAEEIIRLLPEKDDTDTLSAVKYALKKGCTHFLFYGCTGGRTAHTFSNIQTLSGLSELNCRAWMFGNCEVFTCIHNSNAVFSEESKGYISVFSLKNESYGVYEKGLKYLLNNYTMTNGFSIGTSNEFTGEKAEIEVKNGTLLLIYTFDAKEII